MRSPCVLRGAAPQKRESVKRESVGPPALSFSIAAFTPAKRARGRVRWRITMSITLLPCVIRQALAIDVDPAAGRVSG